LSGGAQNGAQDGQASPAERRASSASKRRTAEAAAQAEQAERAARSAPPEPGPDPVDEAEAVGEDDIMLEDDSRSRTELLGQVLGAKVIDEQPNA
jgi:DNA polymerase-3 subunit gamma/tau